MKRIQTDLPELFLLEPEVHGDHRGFFVETYNQREAERLGFARTYVQDNHTRSTRGVLRGLHYQLGRPQAKLVRVVRGEIFDVAVDVRKGSPTFGRHAAAMLSADNHRLLFIPEGFAHGFFVVSETAEVIYKCSDFYAPAEERGVLWSDSALAIPWPIPDDVRPVLSDKDRAYKPLAETPEADLPRYAPAG